MKMNKYSILVLLVFILIISFIMYGFIDKSKKNKNVIRVNGEPVSVEEFRDYMISHHVAGTYDYFKNQYNVEPNKSFWKNDYGQESPIIYIREKTLQDIVRIKLQQILFKQYGIKKDISYRAFLDKLESENNVRKNAVKNGQIIYGPIEYNKYDYFNYVFSNDLIKLKEVLSTEVLKITEEELVKLYDECKNKEFLKSDFIRIQKITVEFNDTKEDALIKIEKANAEIKKGASFEEIAKQYNKNKNIEEQVFDETTAKLDDNIYSDMLHFAGKMNVGDISPIIEITNGYMIMKCTEKYENRYYSFDESYATLKNKCLDSKFEEMLNEMVKSVKIEINQKEYESVYP